MTDKVFIHVGFHKTGSTFLKNEVFPVIVKDNPGIRIISNESFSGVQYMLRDSEPAFYLDVYDPFRMARWLHYDFPDACVVVCLREKRSWKRSLYVQYVKKGGKLGFDVWNDHFSDIDFKEYVGVLRDLFNDVYVCHYEQLRNNPDDFVRGLCLFFDVPMICFSNRFHNVGWSDSQLGLGLFLNRYVRTVFTTRYWVNLFCDGGVVVSRNW